MSAIGSNPTDRFSGVADAYARHRPSYPDEVVQAIISRAGLKRGAQLADVGCGTGICSRLFAERAISVIGIEPNLDMRCRAETTPCVAGPPPIYQDGKAEATRLPDSVAQCITAAQAFHWFEAESALREFHRILKPVGWLALLWYERDESDEFTAAVGDVIRSAPDAATIEAKRLKAGDVLATHSLFVDYDRQKFRHASWLDIDGLKGRALTASYAPKDDAGRAAWTSGLDALHARFQIDGLVSLRYETTLHMARRR